ncbi:MAG: hypothetical protein HQ473_07785, partial [Cryomorphaceae bacterium]|nr:hypothetical protein [Cryomorphaceae bacterium]
LAPVTGEPNGADAIALVMYDGRHVDSVFLKDCKFTNCHGAMFAYGRGYDNRGKLGLLQVEGCEIVNPYGANTKDSLSAFGGGQQFYISPWVARMVYRNCLFDGGGEDMTDPATSPGGRLKDGGAFGSPMKLIFEDNVVRRMGVEALHQTNDITYMTATSTAFTMPPADGSTVEVGILLAASTFQVGDVINVRTSQLPGQPASNNLMRVESVDGPEQLTLSNLGNAFNAGPGTEIPRGRSIYRDTEREPGIVTIRRNLFDGTTPPGSTPFSTKSGIVATAKVEMSANLILDYSRGIVLFDDIHTPAHSANWGSVLRGNLIQTRDASTAGGSTLGIEAWGDETRYDGNFIQAPHPRRFIGIAMYGRRSVAAGNHVHAVQIVRSPYGSVFRSNGIGAGNT